MGVRKYEIARKITGEKLQELANMNPSPLDMNRGISLGRLENGRGFNVPDNEVYVVHHVSLSRKKTLGDVETDYDGFVQLRINTTSVFQHNGNWLLGIPKDEDIDEIFPSGRNTIRNLDTLYIIGGQMWDVIVNVCDESMLNYEKCSWYYRENQQLLGNEYVIVKFVASIFDGEDAKIVGDFINEPINNDLRWRLKKACTRLGMAPTNANVEKLVGKLVEP